MIQISMISDIHMLVTGKKKIALPFLLTTLFILAFIIHKPGYMSIRDPYFWMGVSCLPLSFCVQKGAGSNRMLWPSIFFGLFSIPFTTTFGIYCMLVFCILHLVEQFWGKTSLLFALHLFLLSPLFEYLSNLISFPIRLLLSKVTGKMLEFAGFNALVSGNLIQLNGHDFLVDSACAGLYMLRYSFLFAVIILAFIEKGRRLLRLKEIILLFTGLFFLNIAGNLVRILLLVVFNIMPEHWLHEVLGLGIFLIYMLLPFYYAAVFCLQRKTEGTPDKKSIKAIHSSSRGIVLVLLFFVFIFICFKNGTKTSKPGFIAENYSKTYQFEKVGDIFKLTTEKALIYVKPPVEAYNANHNPLVCWKGSGYSFTRISEVTINGLQCPMAQLTKGDDKLYTVWWFESAKHRTGSQWDWRWRSLTEGEDFSLVNLTTGGMDQLISEAKIFMDPNVSGPLPK